MMTLDEIEKTIYDNSIEGFSYFEANKNPLFLMPFHEFKNYECKDYLILNQYVLIGVFGYFSNEQKEILLLQRSNSMRLVSTNQIQKNTKLLNNLLKLKLNQVLAQLNQNSVAFE